MDIRKAAEELRNIAIKIANEKGITEQQAWSEALEKFKSKYGLSHS